MLKASIIVKIVLLQYSVRDIQEKIAGEAILIFPYSSSRRFTSQINFIVGIFC
jgi:hypothetical protein